MASITKRGNSYLITVSNGYDLTGKQMREYMTWTPDPGMTERQIEKELKRQAVLFEERVKAGVAKDGSIRFAEFADMWLNKYAYKKLKIKTYTEYEKLLQRVNQAIGHMKLKDIRAGHLNAFYENLEESGIRADKKCVCKIDLEAELKKIGINRGEFAKLAGISEKTLRSAIQGNRINYNSGIAISKALGLKFSQVFCEIEPDRLLSSTTVHAYHRVISSCLSKAVKWGYIPYNPATNAESPKIDKKEAKHLDEADARRLLEMLQHEPIKYRAMITFDLMSGLRRGELLGLCWSDVDFSSEIIKIVRTSTYVPKIGTYVDTPKNENSIRVLKLSRSAFVLLREYKRWQDSQREALGDAWQNTDDRVFTNDDGSPPHPDTITKWFSNFVKRAGLPKVTVHGLRHTYASLMIADGTPLVIVSKRMGHAQVSTTANIYAHMISSADEKAAQVTEKFADIVVPQSKEEQRKSSTIA